MYFLRGSQWTWPRRWTSHEPPSTSGFLLRWQIQIEKYFNQPKLLFSDSFKVSLSFLSKNKFFYDLVSSQRHVISRRCSPMTPIAQWTISSHDSFCFFMTYILWWTFAGVAASPWDEQRDAWSRSDQLQFKTSGTFCHLLLCLPPIHIILWPMAAFTLALSNLPPYSLFYLQVGVAGLISPWNLPLYLLTFKVLPIICFRNKANPFEYD